MTTSELIPAGLKLLGVYFLLEGIISLWQAISIVIGILVPLMTSERALNSLPWYMTFPAILYPLTAFVFAFLLLRKTTIFVRLCGLEQSDLHPNA